MLVTEVEDPSYPVLFCLLKLSLFAGAFFALLIWLFQPLVLKILESAAYQPPPATGLLPPAKNSRSRTCGNTVRKKFGRSSSAGRDLPAGC
jgi:hypothetical protein